MRRSLSLTLALLCLAPAMAHAQLRGRVVTADGQPLPAAIVEVWGRAVVHHVAYTDGNGWFTLPPLDKEITRYTFRHIGLSVVVVQREDFRDLMEITLEAGPAYELDGLTA